MDEALLGMMRAGGRNRAWSETMVNLAARELISTANMLAGYHLYDSLTRMKFIQEIKDVVEKQFAIARRAKSDKEYLTCLQALKLENENLKEQSKLLRMSMAKLYAKVEFVRENNKIIGYVISAVDIVLSGIAIFGGGILISTGTPLGIFFGAVLITDGINQITKEYSELKTNSKSEGVIADQTIELAKFMGFKSASGIVAYKSLALASSIYSITGLLRRPGAWRLFRHLPGDFYRKVNTISKPNLTIKIIGYGIKAKVVFDLISIERDES